MTPRGHRASRAPSSIASSKTSARCASVAPRWIHSSRSGSTRRRWSSSTPRSTRRAGTRWPPNANGIEWSYERPSEIEVRYRMDRDIGELGW